MKSLRLHKILMKIGFLVMAFLTIAIPSTKSGAADDAKSYTLDDCLAITLERNLGLKSRNIGVESSSLESRAASAIFDPSLNFNLYDSVSNSGGISSQSELAVGSQSKLAGGDFEINKPLFSGGKWSLKFESGRSEYQTVLAEQNQVFYSDKTTLSYTHPLLEGADSFANRSGITIAELRARQDKLNRDDLVRQLTHQVETSFYETLKSEKAIGVAEVSLKEAQSLYDSVKARFETGYVPAYDVMASESGLASREEALLLAKSTYLNSIDMMKNLMGLEFNENVGFSGDLDVGEIGVPGFDETYKKALENRPDLKAIESSMQVAEIQISVSKNRVLNTLALVTQVGIQGEDTNLSGALGSMNNLNWYLGLNYQMPLGGNREAVTRLKQAELDLESLKFTCEDKIQNITLEVRQALRNLETAIQRISVTSKGVDLQEQKLKMEKARFELGLITSNDLLDFEEDLATARLRFIEARADYLKAISYLDFVTTFNWIK